MKVLVLANVVIADELRDGLRSGQREQKVRDSVTHLQPWRNLAVAFAPLRCRRCCTTASATATRPER